jgi:hypothetical protein
MTAVSTLTQMAIFLAVMLVPLVITAGLVQIWKRWFGNRNRRSPLTSELLRTPAYGLQEKIDQLADDISYHFSLLMIVPLWAYAWYLYVRTYGTAKSPLVVGAGLAAFGLVLVTRSVVKLLELVQERQKYREARDGELATAQLLEPVLAGGGRIFHDVQAEGFNIDHVVVAPGGVFAVETKHRLKPTNAVRNEAGKVRFDGRALHFPGWVETRPVIQARDQAAWLSTKLSRATGVPVTTRPVLALPGWYVDRTGRSDVMVVNPKNTRFMLNPRDGTPLPEDQRNRIAYQLEQLCRMPDRDKPKGAK